MKEFDPEDGCILEGLNGRAYDACIPINVTVEITLRCNIRCTHCYNFDRGEPRPAADPELRFEEIVALLDDLRRAGTLFLSLTGGEALVHPRFWDIADAAAERNFALNVLSNGTLLTEGLCDRLAGYGNLWGAGISVYGARPETHDAITRVPGSFRRTMAGARRLRERGVRASLKFIVMKGNAAEVGEMIDAADKDGIPYTVDTTITGRYDGTLGSLATRTDHETLEALYRGPLRYLLARRKPDPTADEFKCNCARGNGAVNSAGDVFPCMGAPLRAGNIRERSFSEIWKNSPVFQWIRGLRVEDFKTCSPCGLKTWCRRNPGPPLTLHGDYTGVDPWVCKEAEVIRGILEE